MKLPRIMLLLGWLPIASFGTVYTLNSGGDPVVTIDSTKAGRFTVVAGPSGNTFSWNSAVTAVGGTAVSSFSVTGSTSTTLTANVQFTGFTGTYTVNFAVVTASKEVTVTIDGASNSLGTNTLVYPYGLFPTTSPETGSGVFPFRGGYVVPNNQTSWVSGMPYVPNAMEWFGGVNSANSHGWLAIVETPDDYVLNGKVGTFSGGSISAVAPYPGWIGSNNNGSKTQNLLSYQRKLRFQFVQSGGYVALAKKFRTWASTSGWLNSLATKASANPDTYALVGAPIIYLWGDGRADTSVISGLQSSGVAKALIQASMNHWDHQKHNTSTDFMPSNWFTQLHASGFNYLGGFYDVYAGFRGTTPPATDTLYNGFYYLWPSNALSTPAASTDWTYDVDPAANMTDDGLANSISVQKAATFASGTRIPAHLSHYALDALFFDVVAAVQLREDYCDAASPNDHFATRGTDRTNRISLLNTGYTTNALITGTEEGRSWSVPVTHWSEGRSDIGNLAFTPQTRVNNALTYDILGEFDDPVYPSIAVDALNPTINRVTGGTDTSQLSNLFSSGYQVPLWELVYHDCLVTPTHWHRANNKWAGAWDRSDLLSMVRGQAPMLHLVNNGTQGSAARAPASVTLSGTTYSTKWSDSAMKTRILQTISNVSGWHQRVGFMEMTGFGYLVSDGSVQYAEFSPDGGTTGYGIVVNIGNYSGTTAPFASGTTYGPATQHGTSVTVPFNSYTTYTWGTSNTFTKYSAKSLDGWALESASGSGAGGSIGATADTGTASLRIGDDSANKRYRSILSFDTSGLPDGATITRATLTLTRGTVSSGGTPPSTITIDLTGTNLGATTNGFNGSTSLETSDWQALTGVVQKVATLTAPVSNNTSATSTDFSPWGLAAINKTGITQLRIYYDGASDGDGANDYMGFYAGDDTTTNTSQPLLTIYYQ